MWQCTWVPLPETLADSTMLAAPSRSTKLTNDFFSMHFAFILSVPAGSLNTATACIAITADGSVWSWGGGSFGKLGHGDAQNQLLPKKVEAFADQRVVAVSAGELHSLAITADGSIWSWGDGDWGQLGHGDEQRQPLPKKVAAFADRPAR